MAFNKVSESLVRDPFNITVGNQKPAAKISTVKLI